MYTKVKTKENGGTILEVKEMELKDEIELMIETLAHKANWRIVLKVSLDTYGVYWLLVDNVEIKEHVEIPHEQ